MSLGKRIREARLAAGFATQKHLANELGVTRATVSQWETDATVPEASRIPDLVRALHKSWDHLSTGKESKPVRPDSGGVNTALGNVNESGPVTEDHDMPHSSENLVFERLFRRLGKAAKAEIIDQMINHIERQGSQEDSRPVPTKGRA